MNNGNNGESSDKLTRLSISDPREIDELLAIPRDRIVCVDVETTGLSPISDEVLQVSICGGNCRIILDTYVRPERRKRWPKAQEINHITPEMVADAPTMVDVSERIESILGDADLVVGYNIERFDLEFLRVGRVNLPHGMRTYDLINDCSVMFGKWSDYHGDYSFVSLERMAEHYGIEYTPHDSSEDVVATMRLFYAFMRDDALRERVKETRKRELNAERELSEQKAKEYQEELARKKAAEEKLREVRREDRNRTCLVMVVLTVLLGLVAFGFMSCVSRVFG